MLWERHKLSDWASTHLFKRTRRVSTPLGFDMVSGRFIANRMMLDGTFEPEEVRIITETLPDIDVFVDIGANIGYYVCMARARGKHVVAFEPQPQNYSHLLQNLAINGWADVEVFPCGLGAGIDVVELYGSSGPSASLIKGWAGYASGYRQLIPVNRLDNVLGGRFTNKRLFIKIDVEGFEYFVVQGGLEIVRRNPKPVWLIEICLNEFHPSGMNPHYKDTFDLFWHNGYQIFASDGAGTEVTPEMVDRWVDDNLCDLGVFNYLIKPVA